MRIEVRAECDEHEYVVTVEADRACSADTMLSSAVATLRAVTGIYADPPPSAHM